MNRFEQAVHDCMVPTAERLDRTTVARDGVLAFYRSVGEAVLWPSDDRARLARLEAERRERFRVPGNA